ncbi:MAG: lipase family protein [Nitrosomonas sp.]|nr:lipase family protein [Nitrosomonas sp.]
MPENGEITCRLLAASAVSYWIEREGGLAASPLYNSVGYASAPIILVGGKDDIDAITVGSTTDGCVIVACRGTLSSTTGEDKKQVILDWINNLKVKPVKVPGLPDGCRAHDGFFKAVNLVRSSAGKNVFAEVLAQLAVIGSDAKLYITGHSKGGAMSYIVAAQLIAMGRIPDAIISFAAARPGDGDFANYVQDKMSGGEIRRYEVKNDIVPHLPPDLKLWDLLEEAFDGDNENLSDWNYDSVGQLYYYDMDEELEVPKSKISRALVHFQRLVALGKAIKNSEFEEIVDEHSLTDSYGPLICPNLPYGDTAINR